MRDLPPAEPTLDTADFRQLMGLFATGVCVVSARGGGQGLVAMTVNSLVSVSLDPMLVCWSLQNTSSQFSQYAEADHFAISILAEHQEPLARRYAARGDSQLDTADFSWTPSGLPVVSGALGHLECRHWALHAAGDHTMILGEVIGLESGNRSAAPLGFFKGRFCSIDQ